MPWPTYDEALTIDEEVEVVLQVNGKVRSRIMMSKDATKDAMLAAAKSDAKLKEWIDGKTVVKEIVVPGRLVNIVVKD
jgi:leucyl-tRNA synthetase